MVRAILDARKTQTRRIVNPNFVIQNGWPFTHPNPSRLGKYVGSLVRVECPYGQPGDRIWVKETFRLAHKTTTEAKVIYRCDDHEVWGAPWKPSIFMPRWASRITLEITDVRVERVQSITPEDAEAEGLISDEFPIGGNYVKKYGLEGWQHQWFRQSPVDAYERLWDSLNAKRGFGWSVNPWVWVLEFRKICVTSS